MPFPVMAAVGIAAASALVQYMNSAEGRRATAAERARIQRQIDALQSPNFDPKLLTPEDFKVVQKYAPNVSDYIAEANPNLVKADSEGVKAGREAQMNALNKLRNLSNSGTDEQSQLLQQEATNSVNVANRGRQGAIAEDFARRGNSGGGMELLAQLSNAQAANDTQANMGRQNALQAYQTKLQALRDSASLGGTIRGEDVDLESRNNDILNAFNQRTAANRNNFNQYADGVYNDAQRFNTTNAQDVANKNTSTTNQFAQYNQNRDDSNKQQTFNNELNKINVSAGNSSIPDIRNNTKDNNSTTAGFADGAQTALAYSNRNSEAEEKDDNNNPLRRRYR